MPRRRRSIRRRSRRSRSKKEEGENVSEQTVRKRSLKEKLGIPEHETINKTILRRIKDAKVGNVVRLPTQQGDDYVKVDRRLKQQVMAVWNTHHARKPSSKDLKRRSSRGNP